VPRTPRVKLPPSPERLTPLQRARRDRVLDAAIELVAEGGYERVQIRDVSERAGVAAATVYRYFSSKEHLVAAAVERWTESVTSRPRKAWPTGTPYSERLSEAIHERALALQQYPHVAKALLFVRTSSDPFAIECNKRNSHAVEQTFFAALDGLDDDLKAAVVRVIGAVWGTWLAEWVTGQASITQVHEAIVEAAHLVLDPVDAERIQRPRIVRGS
jgi:AcrR family transcriptional regulator